MSYVLSWPFARKTCLQELFLLTMSSLSRSLLFHIPGLPFSKFPPYTSLSPSASLTHSLSSADLDRTEAQVSKLTSRLEAYERAFGPLPSSTSRSSSSSSSSSSQTKPDPDSLLPTNNPTQLSSLVIKTESKPGLSSESSSSRPGSPPKHPKAYLNAPSGPKLRQQQQQQQGSTRPPYQPSALPSGFISLQQTSLPQPFKKET